MFTFFRKKSKPQFEVSFDDAMAGIGATIRSALQEVEMLETYDEALQFEAASHIKTLLLTTERSIAGATMLESMTTKFVEEEHLHFATATSLAMRLVVASRVAMLIDPAKWIDYAPYLANLEGVVAGFVTDTGVIAWPVSYYEDMRFEEYWQSVVGSGAVGAK